MAALKGPFLLAFMLCLAFLPKCSNSSRCDTLSWDDGLGPNPLTARRGNVVLIAFLHGYCSYCVAQARGLYRLKNYLATRGYADIEMVVINGGGSRSRVNIANLINASPIEVIQDREDNAMYDLFGAVKDDFVVYDRCGQLAFHIPRRFTDLYNNITRLVLQAVHAGRHDCYCPLDYTRNLDDIMMGDDTGVPSTNIYSPASGGDISFNCPPGDTVCQAYEGLVNRLQLHTLRRSLRNPFARRRMISRNELLGRHLDSRSARRLRQRGQRGLRQRYRFQGRRFGRGQ